MNFTRNTHFLKLVMMFMLGIGAFSFAHSELDFLNCDTDNHGTHDYCQIYKAGSVARNDVKTPAPVIHMDSSTCPHCDITNADFHAKVVLSISDFFQNQSTPNPVYIINSSFLI
jgi:hypothetical protein